MIEGRAYTAGRLNEGRVYTVGRLNEGRAENDGRDDDPEEKCDPPKLAPVRWAAASPGKNHSTQIARTNLQIIPSLSIAVDSDGGET